MLDWGRFSIFLVVIGLAACSGSGNGPSELYSASELNGRAVKGALLNAKVQAFAVENQAKGRLLATGSTDSQGEFELSVEADYSGAVLIEVSPMDDGSLTLMNCDFPAGCGSADLIPVEYDVNANNIIDFGEQFPVPQGFIMRAYKSSSAGDAYVTPLAHLAASLAEAQGVSDNSIIHAYQQIAQLVGLSEDVFSKKPFDLTELEGQAVSTEQMTFAVLSASVFAFEGDDIGVSLSTYARSLGAANNAETAVVDLARVGKSVTNELARIYPDLENRISEVHTNFQRTLINAQSSGNNEDAQNEEEEQGEIEQPKNKPEPKPKPRDDLAKAKELIGDLRDLGNVFEQQGDTIEARARELADNVALAEEPVNQALREAGHALAVLEDVIGLPEQSFPYVGDGFMITHDPQNAIYYASGAANNHEFEVVYEENVLDCGDSVLKYWDCAERREGYAVSGSVESDHISVEIEGGLLTHYRTEYVGERALDTLELDLKVGVTQKQAALAVGQMSPVKFEGRIVLDVGEIRKNKDEYHYGGSVSRGSSLSAAINALSVVGEISDMDGNSVTVEHHSNDINASMSEWSRTGYYQSESERSDYSTTIRPHNGYEPDSSTIGVNIAFERLPKVNVLFRGVYYRGSSYSYSSPYYSYGYGHHERGLMDNRDGTLVIEYDDKSIEISSSQDLNEADGRVYYISNQQGIGLILNLNGNKEEGVIGIGMESEDAEVLGWISKTEGGHYLVRYSDGSFESLY